MFGVRVTGIGKYVPERVVTNADLAEAMAARCEEVRLRHNLQDSDPKLEQFRTNAEWIYDRTGIKERHYAAPEEATSDLAVKAAVAALADAGLRRDRLEFIILATVSPDHHASPPTACIVQYKLGIPVRGEAGEIVRDVAVVDVSVACSSFIVALALGEGWIRAGRYRAGLVIGADVMSRLVNHDDRSFSPLMGDGAGSLVLERAPDGKDAFGPDNFLLGSDGALAHMIEIPAGGSRMAITPEMILCPFDRADLLTMDGRAVFKAVVEFLPQVVRQAAKKAQRSFPEIGCILLHEANKRITDAVVEKLGCNQKIYSTIHRYGNTTSASIPLSLADAIEEGVIRPGMEVLMVAFGGGLTWATALMRWDC